MRLSNAFGCSI